jgi:arylsulfatase A-like enzyme
MEGNDASMASRTTFSRRDLIKRAALGAAGSYLLSRSASAQDAGTRRPNVVFIITDDQNFNTLGCYGGNVLTPNIDRLAEEGVRFTRNYTAASACTPSRYICLTGRYASRCESEGFLRQNPEGEQSYVSWNTQLEMGGLNIGRALHEAGYATGAVGKWHVGSGPQQKYPQDGDMRDPEIARVLRENQESTCEWIRQLGFDYAASIYRGNVADYKLDSFNAHNPEWITKGALDFIEQQKNGPFFLYLATTLHHSPNPRQSLTADPRMTPAGFLDEVPDVQPARSSIAERLKAAGVPENTAYCTWLDDGVGAVLEKLDALGVADNTAVFFFSDNGTPGKGVLYERGSHTAALLRWPRRIEPGAVCDRLVQNIDFVPTILDICGVEPPADVRLDGQSLIPMLTGAQTEWRDALFSEIGHTRAVSTERWRYIAVRYPPRVQKQIDDGTLGHPPYHMDSSLDLQKRAMELWPHYSELDQLYDLEDDPQEQKNLAGDPGHADRLAEMKLRLDEWLKTFNRPFGEFGG